MKYKQGALGGFSLLEPDDSLTTNNWRTEKQIFNFSEIRQKTVNTVFTETFSLKIKFSKNL